MGMTRKLSQKYYPTISSLSDLPNLAMRCKDTKITLSLKANNLDIMDSLPVKLFIIFHLHLQSMKYQLGNNIREFISFATRIL